MHKTVTSKLDNLKFNIIGRQQVRIDKEIRKLPHTTWHCYQD